MVYCSKCGRKNEDDARFCAGCAAPLTGTQREYGRQAEERCERECSGGGRRGSIIWGIIVILIGLWIVFELGVKNIKGLPDWLANFELWWIAPVVLGIVVVAVGIGLIFKTRHA